MTTSTPAISISIVYRDTETCNNGRLRSNNNSQTLTPYFCPAEPEVTVPFKRRLLSFFQIRQSPLSSLLVSRPPSPIRYQPPLPLLLRPPFPLAPLDSEPSLSNHFHRRAVEAAAVFIPLLGAAVILLRCPE